MLFFLSIDAHPPILKVLSVQNSNSMLHATGHNNYGHWILISPEFSKPLAVNQVSGWVVEDMSTHWPPPDSISRWYFVHEDTNAIFIIPPIAIATNDAEIWKYIVPITIVFENISICLSRESMGGEVAEFLYFVFY